MNRLKNRLVLITGASSGIGLACAEQFAQAGANLLIAARRIAHLEELRARLTRDYGVMVHILPLNVCDATAVNQSLAALPSELQAIDILINNAGLALGLDKIQDANPRDWEVMLDTNVKGLLYVTHYVVKKMLQRNIGHIINIGSLAGHQVYPGGSVYCASKYAVRAITEGLKMDLHGTAIRVSTIDPGLVETDFSKIRFAGDEKRAAAVYAGVEALTAADVADAVVYCATRSAHVNIREIVLTPVAQSSAQMVKRHHE